MSRSMIMYCELHMNYIKTKLSFEIDYIELSFRGILFQRITRPPGNTRGFSIDQSHAMYTE